MRANRANARRSTGPKTAKGKASVRLNAFRHGLLVRDVVLPGEDADVFEELRNQTRANLSPVGPIEEFLADQIVNIIWRLRRLERAETLLFYSRMYSVKAVRMSDKVRSYCEPASIGPFHEMDRAAYTEAREELDRATSERDRDEVLLGRAIDADSKEGDAFAKLSRYEKSLERSLYRALEELRQLQDTRESRTPSALRDAVTLDVNDTTGEMAVG